MRGRDIKRYSYDFADLYIIATFPSKHYDIENYPAIKNYLLSYGIERLEQTGKTYQINNQSVKARKKTNNKWFETQDSISYSDDLFSFAFPNDDSSQFDSDEEYFLGPIVTFRNDRKQKEVIDGQQRLTTLMLLLRAFYERFGNMQDKNSLTTKQNIEHCIWKSDEYGNPDMDALKIDSEVATDNDKDEFLTILRTGVVTDKQKSTYASNYRFFQKKINDFLNDYPSYFALFPT